MADRIVVLNGGRVEQVGTPMDLYRSPATPFVAGFIGSPRMNLFDGEVARAMGCAVYGIRPEHVGLNRGAGQWCGVVRHVEYLGADAIVHLEVPGLGELVARIDGDTNLRPGAETFASPVPGKEFRYGRANR